MRSASVVMVLLGGLAGTLVGQACAHDHDPCVDGVCDCGGADDCQLDCVVSPCEVICDNVTTCDASCQDNCEAACADLTDCELDCGNDCAIECDRLSSCDTACGERCDYACRDVSDCEVAVGPDSVVACERVGNCTVECRGPCRVTCNNVGNCGVRCLDPEGNDAGEPAMEPSGELVCG